MSTAPRLTDLLPVNACSADLPAMWSTVLEYPTDDAPWLVFADKLAEEGLHGLEKAIRERKQIRLPSGELASSFWTDPVGPGEFSIRGDSIGFWAVCGIFRGRKRWNWCGWSAKEGFRAPTRSDDDTQEAKARRVQRMLSDNRAAILAALRGEIT